MLVATLVAAAPPGVDPSSDDSLAEIPAVIFEPLLLEALPPPPATVVRITRYYGTVTIDHVAHLARRAPCKSCHGPTPVTKIVFTPKVAHERCIGCHQQQAKGPTECQGCHVRTAPPPPPAQAAAEKKQPPSPPQPPTPANVAAALAAFDARTDRGDGADVPFHRALEVGFLAGTGPGLSVRFASHQGSFLLTQTVERMWSVDEARTLGLLGAGISRPLRKGVAYDVSALAGFDAFDDPIVALLPAVGVRTGMECRTGLPVLQQVNVSLTTVYDLTTRRSSTEEVGGLALYATVGAGFSFPTR